MGNIQEYKRETPESYIEKVKNITAGNYFRTHPIKFFPVGNLAKKIAEVLLFTEIENVPGPQQIGFLAEQLKNDFPNMEIGEFIIALKNGIIGKYGAIYNSIRIDTIYQWFEKYYSITWPEIEANAARKRLQQKKEETGIPIPDHIKEKFQELAQRVSSKSKLKKPANESTSLPKYGSLAQYAKDNQIDYVEFMAEIDNKLRVQHQEQKVEIEFQLWKAVELQKLLAYYNTSKD